MPVTIMRMPKKAKLDIVPQCGNCAFAKPSSWGIECTIILPRFLRYSGQPRDYTVKPTEVCSLHNPAGE